MDISARIARLRRMQPAGRSTPSPAPPPRQEQSTNPRVIALRAQLDALIARQRASIRQKPKVEPPAPLPGECRDTPHGEVHIVEQFLEPDHHHGKTAIASALDVCPRTVAKLALDTELDRVEPASMVYLDTETTGLAGGTGTLPFLVGMAFFDGRSLTLQQLLLRRPGEEAPMLQMVADRIRKSSCLVTYNGKSFDWPLLRNRFVMNRIPVPDLPAHLDLLHCARRVFKRRLGAVRLVNMEAEFLGFRRVGDIDGAEIPELYWAFVKGAEGSVLTPIIEHNAHDIVALAAILGRLAKRYDQLHRADDALDHLGLAKLAQRAGDTGRALEFARAATDGGEDEIATEALMLTGEILRKKADYDGSREALEEALTLSRGQARVSAIHLALAKLFEHKLRDLDRALTHAEGTALVEGEEAQQKRIMRLQRRIERHLAKKRAPLLALTKKRASGGT